MFVGAKKVLFRPWPEEAPARGAAKTRAKRAGSGRKRDSGRG